MTTERTFATKEARCERCRALHGKPVPAWVGNRGKDQMGHAMYFTRSGSVAACALNEKLDAS